MEESRDDAAVQGNAVSSEYRAPARFKRGAILQVEVNVGDDQYVDVEREAAAMMAREYGKLRAVHVVEVAQEIVEPRAKPPLRPSTPNSFGRDAGRGTRGGVDGRA